MARTVSCGRPSSWVQTRWMYCVIRRAGSSALPAGARLSASAIAAHVRRSAERILIEVYPGRDRMATVASRLKLAQPPGGAVGENSNL